jgi:hypothetical protein
MNTAPRLLWIGLLCGLAAISLLPHAAGAAPAIEEPFGISRRVQPTGSDLNQLLPEKVGRFSRPPFQPDTKIPQDEDLNVTYSAGDERVHMGFSIAASAEDAQDAVKTTRAEAIAENKPRKGELYRIGKDPSFYHLGDFISWTRGNYFYYAKATSRETLAEFMTTFPY